MKTTKQEAKIRELLDYFPELDNTKIGRKLLKEDANAFPSLEAARKAVSKVRGIKPRSDQGTGENVTAEWKQDSGTTTFLSHRIKTLEDALAASDADLDTWEVDRWTFNKWEIGAKHPVTGEILVEPLYQVKVWFRRIAQAGRDPQELFDEVLARFRVAAPKAPKVRRPKTDQLLVEVCLFDAHVGKYAWEAETGQNYDADIAVSLHREAVNDFAEKAAAVKPEKILWPIGNDFFDTDNSKNETTNGTRQDVDGRWERSFEMGLDAVRQGIDTLREVAPVEVVIVPGNHDELTSKLLGFALEGWYSRTSDVEIDRERTLRKYRVWGNNAILFTHGKYEKQDALPIIASRECREWSQVDYTEIHVGHLHHKRRVVYQPVAEIQGTRLRMIPSLAAANAWHVMMGHTAVRAAEMFVHDKRGGIVTEHSFYVRGN